MRVFSILYVIMYLSAYQWNCQMCMKLLVSMKMFMRRSKDDTGPAETHRQCDHGHHNYLIWLFNTEVVDCNT